MSPDTTTAPVIAPSAPVDSVETPSRPVTDDGDHDRFAHYARKDDVRGPTSPGRRSSRCAGRSGSRPVTRRTIPSARRARSAKPRTGASSAVRRARMSAAGSRSVDAAAERHCRPLSQCTVPLVDQRGTSLSRAYPGHGPWRDHRTSTSDCCGDAPQLLRSSGRLGHPRCSRRPLDAWIGDLLRRTSTRTTSGAAVTRSHPGDSTSRSVRVTTPHGSSDAPASRKPWDEAVLTSADGVPYLAPELQLLFKSRDVREKDDVDARGGDPRARG